MELWIRSQNKEGLMQIDNICCMENRIVFIALTRPGRITLGTYKSRERALEVLDDIENFLLGNSKPVVKSVCAISRNSENLIYEMPKE